MWELNEVGFMSKHISDLENNCSASDSSECKTNKTMNRWKLKILYFVKGLEPEYPFYPQL